MYYWGKLNPCNKVLLGYLGDVSAGLPGQTTLPRTSFFPAPAVLGGEFRVRGLHRDLGLRG